MGISISLAAEQPSGHEPELERFVVDTVVQIGPDGDRVNLPHYPITLKEWDACESLQIGIV